MIDQLAVSDATRIEVRSRQGRLSVAFGGLLVLGATLFVVSGEAWRLGPLVAVLLIVGTPLIALGVLSMARLTFGRVPALVIGVDGVTINHLLAPVRFIPASLIRDLRPIERDMSWRRFTWLEVVSDDHDRLVSLSRWPWRALVMVEGGRVLIPTSNLDHSPSQVEQLIRSVVIRRRGVNESG